VSEIASRLRLPSVLELRLIERCLDKHWTSSSLSGEGCSVVCGEAVTSPTSNSTRSDASALAKAPEAGAGFEWNGLFVVRKASHVHATAHVEMIRRSAGLISKVRLVGYGLDWDGSTT
jgi:hypothetical protein